MDLFTPEQQAALKDGADALRYRSSRLRNHPLYDGSRPESEQVADSYERHAGILEDLAKARM